MGSVAEIEQLQRELRRRVPEAKITVDEPDASDGVWWVDIEREGRVASVEWSRQRGYGVAAPGGGYGERPDFIAQSAETAADLIAAALAEPVASK